MCFVAAAVFVIIIVVIVVVVVVDFLSLIDENVFLLFFSNLVMQLLVKMLMV
jgi:hypothetical protein